MINEPEKQEQKKLLKVRYYKDVKPKNKVFQINGLSYHQIAQKIFNGFQLNSHLFYFLTYLDADKDQVHIDCQSDFDIFLENAPNLILELKQCKDFSLHFMKKVQQKKEKSQSKTVDLKEHQNLLTKIEKLNKQLREADQKQKQQEEIIKQLRIKNKFQVIEQKKKEIDHQLNQYKITMQQKYKKLIEEKLKQKLQKFNVQKAKHEQQQDEKGSISSQKVKAVRQILSIPLKQAQKLVLQHPQRSIEDIINMHLSK